MNAMTVLHGTPLQKQISVVQWSKFIDNPRQRDTERHAKTAALKHLKEYNQVHAQVAAGVLPDGTIYKLDGHTRLKLWEDGSLRQPPVLLCTFWPCSNIEEIMAAYDTFDSQFAVETSVDKISGAKREHGLSFMSPLLKGDKFTYGLKTATQILHTAQFTRSMSTSNLVGMWIPELQLLDSLNSDSRAFSSGVMAAALICFRRFGANALPFWKAYSEKRGVKNADEMDPVHALEERMQQMRIQRKMAGDANINFIVRIALSAFEAQLSRRNYKVAGGVGVRPINQRSMDKWSREALAIRP